MSRHPNTFDEGDDINPFANASGQSSKSQLPTTQSDPNRHDATDDVPLGHEKDPKKKEKDIAAWEADLVRREQEIKKREDALAKAGFIIEEKNWPPFFPIIHHDIAKEIPVNAQRIQYLAFASWLGIMLCLVWNFVAVVACCIKEGGVKILFLSIIYALTGCPGSYLLWYKPLYNAMRTDSMLHFGWFFLVYLIHIGFCIVATIAPPILFEGTSLTGFLAAFDTFSGSGLVGIFYLIGSCLFCLETLLSALVLQRIYAYFRGEK